MLEIRRIRIALLATAAAGLGVCALYAWVPWASIRGSTAEQRVDSICRLADEKPRGAAAAVAAATSDPEPIVRRAAVVALETFRRPDDRPRIEQALQDHDVTVRVAAAETLGRYGPETVPQLEAIAQSDPDPQARVAAVVGLGRTGRGPGMAALAHLMEKTGDPEVQKRSLAALESVMNIRYAEPPDPRDAKAWADFVQKVKRKSWVREALAGTGEAAPTTYRGSP